MSKLGEALRERFRTPKEAVEALGLDPALLAMDSLEGNPSGRLNQRQQSVTEKTPNEREEIPAHVFLEPGKRLYPVKEKAGGGWKYSRNLLLAAARRARMQHHDEIARRADEIRAREFPDQQAHDEVNMSTLKSRRALLAAGAITAYVRPRLAQDAKFDPVPALVGVTAKNYAASIPAIIERVKDATKGKLAYDASPEELKGLLSALQGQEEGEDEINPANPGLPDETHDPINDAEVDGSSPAHQFLASKLSPEDHGKFKQLQGEDRMRRAEDRRRADDERRRRAEDARRKLGRDETEEEMEAREKREDAEDAKKRLGRDETPEEMKAREKGQAEDRKRRRAEDARRREAEDSRRREAEDARRREAEDARRREAEDAKRRGEDKKAMDEAIQSAVSAERIAQRAIQTALEEVRPYVGKLNVAFDSAEQVYRRALEMRGETGLDAVHPSAYQRLLLAKPAPGHSSPTLVAMDSAGASADVLKSMEKIAPGISKVRIG